MSVPNRSTKGRGSASVAASRAAGTVSKVSASTSRRPGAGEASNRPQIVDPLGRNLTPKPLAAPPGTTVAAKARAGGGAGGTLAQSGVSVASDGDLGGDTQSAGGFTHSVASDAESTGAAADVADADESAGDGGADAGASDAPTTIENTARANQVAIESEVDLTSTWTRSSGLLREALLDAMVTATLSETDTVLLFEQPSVRVQQDTAESRLVTAANQRYEALCVTLSKSSAELYPSRSSETLVPPTKHKEVMVAPASVANASAQVDSFDLADSLAIERGSAFAGSSAASGGGSMNRRSSGSAATLDRAVSAVMTVSLAAAGCQLDAEGAVCVIPTGVPAVSASGPGAAGSSTRNGLLSGTSLAKGGRARQPGLAASVAIAPPQAQRRLSAAAQSSATVSVSVASDAATGAGDAPSSSKAAEAPAAVELILDAATRAQATRVFASRALLDSLTLVERAVQQNQYHDAHRRYRGGPAIDVVEGLLAAGASGGHAAAAAVLAQAVGGSTPAGSRGNAGGGGAPAAPKPTEGVAAAAGAPPAAPGLPVGGAPPPPPRGGGRNKRAGAQHFHSGLDGPIEEGEEDEEEEDDLDDDDDASGGGGRSDGSGEDDDGDEGNDEDVGEEAGEGALAGANSTAVGASAAAVTPAAASVAAPVTGAAGDGSAAAAAAGAAALVHAGVPGLQRLWSYFTPLVDGMNVSGMDWNKSYRDLLAVGYGPYDLTTSFSGRGLVALWAITNPEYPQAILRTRDNVGVTSVAFSTAHPNLLAAGLYDGSVCVWDTRQLLVGTQDGALPAMVSDQLLPGAHSEAVWGVKWVQKNELGEVLVSISTDGRVTQWDTKKGLVPTPIMTLKRARAPPAEGSALAAPKAAGGSDAGGTAAPAVAPAALEALGATGSEGLLSRTASGLTIDFVKEDPSQYFVGTEDGLVAQCSTSYSEQYLSTLQAHAGPVSRLRLSPFLSHALLTASADWTVRLWNLNAPKPVPVTYTVDSIRDTVTDIAWSPSMSTLFAAVTRDGHITVWDAAHLSPLIDHAVTIEPEAWAAMLAAEAAAQAAAEAAAAEEALRLRREARGEDDAASDGEEATAMAAAAALAVESAHALKRAGEAEAGGSAPASLGSGRAPAPRQPPRKKLSCVLFAENTHVLVTGDSSGRVDVYRVVGLAQPADTGADIAGGSSPAPEGSEAHEAQLEALAAVLLTTAPA